MVFLCYKCKKIFENSDKKHGLHLHCFKDWFRLADESEDFESLNLVKEKSSYGYRNKSFFHGKFEKYSASLGGRDYILKISREYPELSKVEYVCNQLGILVGLSIPDHYLLRFQEQEDCFVSDNFMKDFKGSNLEHIWRFLKKTDKFTLETLLKVIEKKTGRLSEIQKFIRLCLFDALIGNHDRHGRNLGLIHTPQEYLFSPCYDNPSYFGTADFLGASHAPRGAIATSTTEEPMMRDYIKEFVRLGFKDEINRFKKGVDIKKVKFVIQESLISEARKSAFLKFIERQYQELNNVL